MGNKGEGSESREVNLKQYDKALIGFRGCYKDRIFDFYAYVAQRLDILNDAADDLQPQGNEGEDELIDEADNE